MLEQANKLNQILLEYAPLLKQIPDEAFYAKANPRKWSKVEIMGHLVDSAQNNIRRFIVSKYEDNPFIIYNQDKWVAMGGYQDLPAVQVIELWELLNRQIIQILARLTETDGRRTCLTNDPTTHSVEWLAADYLRHLLHHLHQVLDKEAIAYP